jgi:hypothetical protein
MRKLIDTYRIVHEQGFIPILAEDVHDRTRKRDRSNATIRPVPLYELQPKSAASQQVVVARQTSLVERQTALVERQMALVARQTSLVERQKPVVARQMIAEGR